MKELERDIQTIDAEGKSPGRLATHIAKILIGKHKPTYMPNIDSGDHVQVVNAAKMKITGKKIEQKVYHHHTTFASGLRTVSMKALMSSRPAEVLERAVSRMLPKNKLRVERLKRLLIKN